MLSNQTLPAKPTGLGRTTKDASRAGPLTTVGLALARQRGGRTQQPQQVITAQFLFMYIHTQSHI